MAQPLFSQLTLQNLSHVDFCPSPRRRKIESTLLMFQNIRTNANNVKVQCNIKYVTRHYGTYNFFAIKRDNMIPKQLSTKSELRKQANHKPSKTRIQKFSNLESKSNRRSEWAGTTNSRRDGENHDRQSNRPEMRQGKLCRTPPTVATTKNRAKIVYLRWKWFRVELVRME